MLEELKDQGVDLHLIDLGGSAVIANGVSKMVFTILAAVAEGERDRIRERIRDAKLATSPRRASTMAASAGRLASTSSRTARSAAWFPTRPRWQ